jgi:hypothetical protein
LIDERTRAIVITKDNRIYVGSNSAVLGSDLNGSERSCTVTDDAVTVMCEITRDHQKRILSASDDELIGLFLWEESNHESRVKGQVFFEIDR